MLGEVFVVAATQSDIAEKTIRKGGGFDDWHNATCRSFSMSECKGDTGAVFNSQMEFQKLGPLSLTTSTSTFFKPLDLVRGATEIRKDPRDHFMLYLVLRGAVNIAQDGRQASLRFGDLAIYDQTRPFTIGFCPGGHQAILVNIARPLLVARLPRASNLTASRVAGTLALGALAGSIAVNLSQLGEAAGINASNRLGASAIDVWSTVLESSLSDASRMPESNYRLEQVKRYMLANIHNGDLSVYEIAKAQGMSSRTMNRLFVQEGTTPMRWLWRRRLDESYRALAEGQMYHVADVACHYGFSDPSHFSRTFKKTFGHSPHTVRAIPMTSLLATSDERR
jgi:AraC-like DNA-binding protein